MAAEVDHNWVVPVTVQDSYWGAQLYMAGYPNAAQAKQNAQGLMDTLAAYTKPVRPFVVGDAVRVEEWGR